MPVSILAFFASFGFVLTYFSGRFVDSVGLSGFVLQNFRFFFFAFSQVTRTDHRRSAGFKPIPCASGRATLA
jgi:hypothetical protein